ncbi:MAG: sugar phosphate isomerase/epimerase [Rubripirellula sp.]|nr:sugar phosphate isomerase/epimerase [Rubripirellula sp.]
MAELKLAVRLDAMRMPLKRALQQAAKWGATAVELDARNEIHPSQLSDTGLRQLRKILEDGNLRVASVRFLTRRGYDNPADLDRRVEATKDAMLLAYRLGAPVVINSIGTVLETEEDDPRMDLLHSVLHDLGRYGAKVGAFLAAETGNEPGETLAKALGNADDAFVAVALNPGQLIINRHSVSDAIAALRDRIQIVSAVDGVIDLAAGRGLSVPLGQGTADFPELIGRLEDIPYRGFYTVGRPDSNLNELASGLAYLRQLGN